MVIRLTRDIKFAVMAVLIITAFVIQIFYMGTWAKEDKKIRLPVIMYHQITEKKSKVNTYRLLKSTLENDLKYIKENGFTSITMSELIDIADGKKSSPEKPVIITFDDGFESIKQIVLPLLEKYGLKAVVSVVGEYADNSEKENDHNVNYSYLDWNEIKELNKSKYIEIQNHSYSMHKITKERKGASKRSDEDYDTYRKNLSEDILKFQNKIYEKTDYRPNTFTFPFGCISEESSEILKNNGFRAALTCFEKMNYIDTKNTDWLYSIGRYNRNPSLTTESFFDRVLNNREIS